jgi:hypothetical protein
MGLLPGHKAYQTINGLFLQDYYPNTASDSVPPNALQVECQNKGKNRQLLLPARPRKTFAQYFCF